MSTGASQSVGTTATEAAAAPPPPARRGVVLYLGGVAMLLAAVLGVVGLGARRASQAREEASARVEEAGHGLRVRVARTTMSTATRKLTLQGEARPFAQVTLYAKVSGYLKEVRVDKGDVVKANQILATIEAPELDKQIASAAAY